MKLTAKDFLALPHKRITLMGMSGCGKSYITALLEKFDWDSYSCDYQIGMKYLKDHLADMEGFKSSDIRALSTFIGKLGNPDLGGYSLDTFKARQKAYYDAECSAIKEAVDICKGSDKNFVHDSTGSLCEIMDDDLLAQIGQQTLFVYLKASEADEKDVLKRAQKYPKPLFFPPAKMDVWIEQYLDEQNIQNTDEIVPDDFARYVFPKLFESRKPKYERLSDLYGVTIPAREFLNFESEDDFFEIIAKYLP